jgi:hypothetical protein
MRLQPPLVQLVAWGSVVVGHHVLQHLRKPEQPVAKCLSNPETPHEESMIQTAKWNKIRYFRFNVGGPFDDKRMDDCRPNTISQIEEATRKYLQKPETQDDLWRCAKYLVGYRRERTNINLNSQPQNGGPIHPQRSYEGFEDDGSFSRTFQRATSWGNTVDPALERGLRTQGRAHTMPSQRDQGYAQGSFPRAFELHDTRQETHEIG